MDVSCATQSPWGGGLPGTCGPSLFTLLALSWTRLPEEQAKQALIKMAG